MLYLDWSISITFLMLILPTVIRYMRLRRLNGLGDLMPHLTNDNFWFAYVAPLTFLLITYPLSYFFFYKEQSKAVFYGFNVYSCVELGMFISILILILISYRGCLSMDKFTRKIYVRRSMNSAIGLFYCYIYIIIHNAGAQYFNNMEDFYIAFINSSITLEKFHISHVFTIADNDYIFFCKLFIALMSILQLFISRKAYLSGLYSHNFFVITLFALWLQLFVISTGNLFYIFLIFDAISFCSAAFIVMHEKSDEFKQSTFAMVYTFLSGLTTWLACIGFYILFKIFNSLDINVIFNYFMYSDLNDNIPMNKIYFAFFLISIKFLFLLGTFPFYRIVIDMNFVSYYATNYFFFVTSKLPVILLLIKFLALQHIINNSIVLNFILICFGCSILYGGFCMLRCLYIKNLLAYSSLSSIPMLCLFGIYDISSFYFYIIFSFFIYACAMFVIIFYLQCIREQVFGFNVRHGGGEVQTFTELLKASQSISIRLESFDDNRIVEMNDFPYFIIKSVLALSIMSIMGVAVSAGFIIKFILITAVLKSSSYFICCAIILNILFSHMAYFSLFRSVVEINEDVENYIYKEFIILITKEDYDILSFFFVIIIWLIIFSLGVFF